MYWLASVVAVLARLAGVAGHGAVVFPPPRQALDRVLHPWTGPLPDPRPADTDWCPVAGPNGTLVGLNGQAKIFPFHITQKTILVCFYSIQFF